jgi:2-phosphoglycerate kinase
VIEGAHVVPGFFDVETRSESLLAVPFVVGVDDEERHRSHFAAREDAVEARIATRYAEGFGNIRKLQRYVTDQALAHGVPVIPNHSFDQSIAAVIDLVMERATTRAAELRSLSEPVDGAPRIVREHDEVDEKANKTADEKANEKEGIVA